MWYRTEGANFVLEKSLFGSAELTKNYDYDKYRYFDYSNGSDARGSIPLSDGNRFAKIMIVFGFDLN